MSDKKEIYLLIDRYLAKKIKAWDFCNVFVKLYNIEIDIDTLTKNEEKAFSDLNTVASRFTDIEDDLKKYPGTYFDREQLDKQVDQIKKRLLSGKH